MNSISSFIFNIVIPKDFKFNGFTGRVVHGAFLQFIRNHDGDLAEEIHNSTDRKPFCIAPIRLLKRDRNKIAKFVVNTYSDKIIETLLQMIIKDAANEIFIIDRFFHIVKLEYQKNIISQKKEIAKFTKIRLRFQSPTIFANDNRNAKSDPYPHLDVIWKHMIHNYSRIFEEIDQETQAILLNKLLHQLATPHFVLKSRHLTLGHKIKVTGFVGTILFKVENNKDLDLLLPILELHKTWNIGGKTSMGFGNLHITINPPKTENKKQMKNFEQAENEIISN